MVKRLLFILILTSIILTAKNLGNINLEISPICHGTTSGWSFYQQIIYRVHFSNIDSLENARDINLRSNTKQINFDTYSLLYSNSPAITSYNPNYSPPPEIIVPSNYFSVTDTKLSAKPVSINNFTKLVNDSDNLKLEFIRNKKTTKTVKEKVPFFEMDTNEYIKALREQKEPPVRYRDVNKTIMIDESVEYHIKNAREKWDNAVNSCQRVIDKDHKEFLSNLLLKIILLIIIFIIIFYSIKSLIKISKKKISQGKEKLKEIEKQREEKRVRKIAEEESIRASVKKSIDESKNDDLEELQKLINKAVEKGDSETAQALLKILNSKQDK